MRADNTRDPAPRLARLAAQAQNGHHPPLPRPGRPGYCGHAPGERWTSPRRLGVGFFNESNESRFLASSANG